MRTLIGKTALVTGAGSGLGRAMAQAFAREGVITVVADRRLDAAQAVVKEILAAGGQAEARAVDVTDRASLEALAEDLETGLGGPDILVNNAGVLPLTPILQPEEQGWRWEIEVNLFGVVYGLQTFLPRMLRRGREGHVINTASISGMLAGGRADNNRIALGERGFPDHPAILYGYTASKFAVVGLTEALRNELAGTRVGVSLLCPHAHHSSHIDKNSSTNRPERFGGATDPADLIQGIMTAAVANAGPPRDDRPRAIQKDPAELGARVVAAIRNEQFYIFTHPMDRLAIEDRFAVIRAGLDDADAFGP